MVTLAAREELYLSELAALPGVSLGLKLADKILAKMVDVSPSLQEISVILNDRVFEYNIAAI